MLTYDYNTKEAYIYFSSDLPTNGWFQKCVICDKITAKIELYKKIDDIHIYYYKCNPCKKAIISEKAKENITSWLKAQYNKYKFKFIY